jgi:hypothetical protein
MKVLSYSRHPTADLMGSLLEKHKEKQLKFKAFCERNQRKDSSLNFEFSLYFFIDRKVKKGKSEGKSAKAVVLENREHVRSYY